MRYLQVDTYKLNPHKWLMSLNSLFENLIPFSQWKSEAQFSSLKSSWFWFRGSVIFHKSHHWQVELVSKTSKFRDREEFWFVLTTRSGISERQGGSQNNLDRRDLWRPLGPVPCSKHQPAEAYKAHTHKISRKGQWTALKSSSTPLLGCFKWTGPDRWAVANFLYLSQVLSSL